MCLDIQKILRKATSRRLSCGTFNSKSPAGSSVIGANLN